MSIRENKKADKKYKILPLTNDYVFKRIFAKEEKSNQ